MIAALFVSPRGPYMHLPDVDAWTAERDARLYAGPVVAHPPCERWGRYYWGGPGWKGERKQLGDDDGCFASALAAVRMWGGVLEHPAGSRAWERFGLRFPPREGGWVSAGDFEGWTCCVDQGHYGHRAQKATWLYAAGVRFPPIRWGKAERRVRIHQTMAPEARRRVKAPADVQRARSPIEALIDATLVCLCCDARVRDCRCAEGVRCEVCGKCATHCRETEACHAWWWDLSEKLQEAKSLGGQPPTGGQTT